MESVSRRWLRILAGLLAVVVLTLPLTQATAAPAAQTATPNLQAVANGDGTWGVRIDNVGKATVANAKPIRIDTYWFGSPTVRTQGYSSITTTANGFIGRGTLIPFNGVSFEVTDTWSRIGNVVSSQRSLLVRGSDGLTRFMDALALDLLQPATRAEVDYFVPAMIYGNTANIGANTIGGSDTYSGSGTGIVRIREDRLPAPLFALRFNDNSSIALLNAAPKGDTIKADSDDAKGSEIVDTRLNFGALGAEQPPSTNRLTLGYWFPGSEGEVTYANNSGDGPQRGWRLRLHPIQDGLTHSYTLRWRFGANENQLAFQKNSWRVSVQGVRLEGNNLGAGWPAQKAVIASTR